MEKFLTTKSKPKKEQHLPVNITASERARQYQRGTFHASENLLFCSTCNVVVDHLRKYVVDRHLQSSSHQVKAERKDHKGRALLKVKHSKSIGFYLNVKEMLEKPKKGKKTPLKIPALFSIFPHYFAFFRTISRTIWQNFPHYFPFFPALYQKPCFYRNQILAPVVQKVDGAIYQINHYPVDKY